jgi:hypothetical protein
VELLASTGTALAAGFARGGGTFSVDALAWIGGLALRTGGFTDLAGAERAGAIVAGIGEAAAFVAGDADLTGSDATGASAFFAAIGGGGAASAGLLTGVTAGVCTGTEGLPTVAFAEGSAAAGLPTEAVCADGAEVGAEVGLYTHSSTAASVSAATEAKRIGAWPESRRSDR